MPRCYAIVAVAALLALAGCGDSSPQSPAAPAGQDAVSIRVGDADVRAEVADDSLERERGLSGRPRLGPDEGMYFVLTNETPHFWMKGMRFGLDIVWIKDGRVVDVSTDVPPPRDGVSDAELPIYSPARAADRALEVNAGWTKRNGVQPGARVRITG